MPQLPHFGHIKNFSQKMGEFIGNNTGKSKTKRQYIILKVTKSYCSQDNQ